MDLDDLARVASYSRIKLHLRLSDLVVPVGTLAELRALGREQDNLAELRNNSLEPRSSILILGSSGSGKSSLAQAFASDVLSVDILDAYDCANAPGQLVPASIPKTEGFRKRLPLPQCVLLENCNLLGTRLSSILEGIYSNTVVICTALTEADGIDDCATRRFGAVIRLERPDLNDCRTALRKMGLHELSVERAAPVLSRLQVAYSGIQRFVLNARRRKAMTPGMSEPDAIEAELSNPAEGTIRRF